VKLGHEHGIDAYDAYILECARRYGTPLLSLDTEARQRLARVLDEARTGGKIRIKRRDGSESTVRPVSSGKSPLDVPGVDTGIKRADILAAIHESRAREPAGGPTK